MIIQAYKCVKTGKIFEKEEDYNQHVKEIKREERILKKEQKIKDTFFSWVEHAQDTISSLAELETWIIENQHTLITAYNTLLASPSNGFYRKVPICNEYLDIKFTCKFTEQASNSHSCPKNGVTNWIRDKKLPQWYHGFVGQVSGSIPYKLSSLSISSLLEMVNIHTGTGGGYLKYGYGVTIFTDDWPGLARAVMLDRLKG